MIFASKYVFRLVFEGGFLGGARNLWGNPYLNSTTVLFDRIIDSNFLRVIQNPSNIYFISFSIINMQASN